MQFIMLYIKVIDEKWREIISDRKFIHQLSQFN